MKDFVMALTLYGVSAVRVVDKPYLPETVQLLPLPGGLQEPKQLHKACVYTVLLLQASRIGW